jgi:hypothetical protein
VVSVDFVAVAIEAFDELASARLCVQEPIDDRPAHPLVPLSG